MKKKDISVGIYRKILLLLGMASFCVWSLITSVVLSDVGLNGLIHYLLQH